MDATRLRAQDSLLTIGDIPEGALLRRVGNRVVGQATGAPAKTAGSTYLHNQSTPATTWTITHNLGKYPSVTVVDSAGTVCIGGIAYVSVDKLVLTFSAAFSGKAFLN